MNAAAGVLLVRVFVGILFFFQGWDKVFRINRSELMEAFLDRLPERGTSIHPNLIISIVFISSLAELLGGAFLILGLFRNISMYALAADLVLVSLFFSATEPMWNTRNVFPRLAAIAALLLLPQEWDLFALDNYLHF